MEDQAKDAENDETSAADVNSAEAEAPSSTSAFIAPVFNIVAGAARSPFHALSLPDQAGRTRYRTPRAASLDSGAER